MKTSGRGTSVSQIRKRKQKSKKEPAAKPDALKLNIEKSDPSQVKTVRRLGFLKGQISVPDDFDTMFSAEIEEMFYGSKLEPEE